MDLLERFREEENLRIYINPKHLDSEIIKHGDIVIKSTGGHDTIAVKYESDPQMYHRVL